MEEKVRCQSCGMPLGTPGGYGTNFDGSENHDFCKFCFQKGAFVQPDLTVGQMVDSSINFMTANLHYSREEAERMSREIIPKLKRWQK